MPTQKARFGSCPSSHQAKTAIPLWRSQPCQQEVCSQSSLFDYTRRLLLTGGPDTNAQWLHMIASLSSRLSHVLTLSKKEFFLHFSKANILGDHMHDVFLLRQWAPLSGFEQPVLARFTRAPAASASGPNSSGCWTNADHCRSQFHSISSSIPEGIHGFPGKIHCLVYIYI